MKKQLVSTSMLLMLLISVFFIAVPIMPTSASPESELHVVPFTLNTTGSATAEWTTADKYTGSYSVKLTTSTTGDYAGFGFTPIVELGGYNGTIDSINSLSFWYKHISYAGWCGPRMALVMVKDTTNYLAVTGCAVNSAVWKKADAVNGVKDTDWYTTGTGSQIWWYGTWDGENLTSYSQIGGPITFSTLNTTLTGADILGVAIYMGMVSPYVGAGSAYIDDTEVNGVTYYGRIQDAIDTASSGDTIIVHDGTYAEQVVINKRLTLQGTGSTPIIKPSSAANLTTILDGRYWGGTKQIAGIIVANVADGSNVTVKNLIVDGENVTTKPTGADYVTGIFYRETGGLIDTVTIANMTIDATGTSVRAYGIYLSAIVNTVSVEIKDCNITNYDKNGVNAHGDKLTVNIHDNTIAGRGPLPSGDEVQNGIVIMDSAIATVNSNTISNMAYIPETWWSAGILFLDGGNGCSANHNTINNCQIGIIFNDMSGSATGNTVNGGTEGKAGLVLQQAWGTGTWTASFVGNTVNGCDTEGIGVHSYDAGTSLTATLDSNQLNGGLGVGIFIGDVPASSPAGNITVIITNNNISDWRHGIHLASSVIGATITNNTIIDFKKGGIVARGAKNIFMEGNTISTTLHDEAPNGIDIGIYTGTTGTVKENEISGCSWNGFTGDYETSWSGSGILVIESGDSLELSGNIVYDSDVGMDIESDSMNITHNCVHSNIYGFVFWNANPKVNYNNIYSNTAYGVYRTTLGSLTGTLDTKCNWWGDASGPTHSSNPGGTGDAISDNVDYSPWLGATFETTPRTYHVNPTGAPGAIQEAIDEASSGDTIIVHDGTYNEALYINGKSLTIKAASTPVIQGSQLVNTNYGVREAVIFVENAANVVLEGLDIEGLGFGSGPPKSYGVIYEESTGTIKDCIVSTNMIGDMYDVGIAAWDGSNLAVESCTVKNFGRIGIFYYDGCSGGVYNSIIEGQVYSDENYVNYGIEIESSNYPCDIEIIGNEIYNCDNTHPSPLWSSAGIVIDGWLAYYSTPSSTVIMRCNNIYDNYYGIEVVANPYSYAHYNNIYSNRECGVIQDSDYLGNNVTFDARYNWWGDATGPYHPTLNPTGLGDDVSDNVSFAPWLLQEKTPPLVHDVAVTSVTINATTVYVGDIVRINVTIENQGNTYETFNVTAYYDDNPIDTQTLTDMVPGTSIILTFEWNTTGMSAGDYTIKAIADVVLNETDTIDNTFTDGTVTIITVVRDITIISVVPNVAYQYPERIVNITVVVKNNGEVSETFNVTAYRDNIPIGTILVTNLGVGENTTIIFQWNTSGLTPCYNWTIKAETPLVGDINPSDNTLTDGTVKIKMIGDVNGDGIIDIYDLVISAEAFGSKPGDPNWNPDAELVLDGLIDIFDLVRLSVDFGMKCP